MPITSRPATQAYRDNYDRIFASASQDDGTPYDGKPCLLPVCPSDKDRAEGLRFEYASGTKRNIKSMEWFHGYGAFEDTIVLNNFHAQSPYYPLRAIKIKQGEENEVR